MRFRFFTIPVHDSATVEAELDRFVTTHRVISVERQLVVDGPQSAWAMCVTWVDPASTQPSLATTPRSSTEAKPGKNTADYREILSPEDFQRYSVLRALRKAIAEREGIPAYAVFTNEHLAAIVTGRACTASDLAKIPGVGQSRIDKHGAAFLAALREPLATTPPTPTPTHAT